jgi:radical SAM superfamily enzyme
MVVVKVVLRNVHARMAFVAIFHQLGWRCPSRDVGVGGVCGFCLMAGTTAVLDDVGRRRKIVTFSLTAELLRESAGEVQ